MKNSEWDAWLQGWLQRNPLRSPPEELTGRFRQEVMSRIRAKQAPVHTLRWMLEPRWSFALGGALAAVLALVVLGRPHTPAPAFSTQEIEQEARVLLEAGEVTYLADLDLEGELRDADRLVLAEAVAPKPDSSWSEFENDMEVLDLLEEEGPPAAKTDRVTDEELLEELKRIDDAEMALS